MTPSAPDRELPARVEDEAMERAVREHAALVYRVARAVLRNHHDAEDAAQEVFLRVLRLRPRLEGVENTKTWFARVAFRVALDRRARPGFLSLDDAGAERLRSREAAADDVAADRQVSALIASKVAALPGDLRHAVRLSTIAGLSSPEIAGLLGIPEGTVRTRLMRARRILRLSLAAALGLVLAAAGILLRKREPEERIAAGPAVPPAPTERIERTRPEEISSKGEEAGTGADSRTSRAPAKGASPLLARAGVSHPSKRIFSPVPPSRRMFFPSPVPLGDQERLLLAYVASTEPPETDARSGFLDEPAPLPPLPSDSPSSLP